VRIAEADEDHEMQAALAQRSSNGVLFFSH
jgi:hypothetical protein